MALHSQRLSCQSAVLLLLVSTCSSRRIGKDYPNLENTKRVVSLPYVFPVLSPPWSQHSLSPKVSIKEQTDPPPQHRKIPFVLAWGAENRTLKAQRLKESPIWSPSSFSSFTFPPGPRQFCGRGSDGSSKTMWKTAGANILRVGNPHFLAGGTVVPRCEAKYLSLPFFFFFPFSVLLSFRPQV